MPATVTGESPLDRQLWLYRELYGLPCRLSGTRIMLSTSDISAIRVPEALAAHVDDELFWLEKVTPILDEHPGTGVLTLLAAPTHLDLTFPATDFRRRARCEFLPPERELILPAPRTPHCLGPRWFRYPQWETLQPVTTVLRAIRVALHTYPA